MALLFIALCMHQAYFKGNLDGQIWSVLSVVGAIIGLFALFLIPSESKH